MWQWLWNLLAPGPMFPAKPLRWGGRVPKRSAWEMTVITRPSGEQDIGWRWPSGDFLTGLSEPYDYFGKPPEHQQSRKIT